MIFIDLGTKCKFEVDHLMESDCGQLLQDKLDENCDLECQDFKNKIDSTASAVVEAYEVKEEEVNTMVEFQKGIKSAVENAIKAIFQITLFPLVGNDITENETNRLEIVLQFLQ